MTEAISRPVSESFKTYFAPWSNGHNTAYTVGELSIYIWCESTVSETIFLTLILCKVGNLSEHLRPAGELMFVTFWMQRIPLISNLLRGHCAVTTRSLRSLRGVTTVTTRSLRGHYAVTAVTTRSLRLARGQKKAHSRQRKRLASLQNGLFDQNVVAIGPGSNRNEVK